MADLAEMLRLRRQKAALENPPGLVEPGNIDVMNRPAVKNPDGRYSTVFSMGVGFDSKEYLLPRVSEKGKFMSPDEAVQEFKKTGKHLGVFDSVEASNAYGEALHLQQASLAGTKGRSSNKRYENQK